MKRWPAPLIAALFACTGGAPPPPTEAKADAQATAAASATPPAAPTATPQPIAAPPVAAPTPAPASGPTWWCACYYRQSTSGPQPVTACRANEAECKGLEKSVAKGSKGIVQGTLTHPCQAITGEHPGDAHGGREAWQPSKKPGAWISQTACQLPGTGAAVDLNPTMSAAGEDDPFPVLDSESIGGLKYGMTAAEVVKAHGEPTSRGKKEEWEADAAFHQSWDYPALGLTVGMVSTSPRGAQTVESVAVKAPSTMKSAQGITIGSPRADVLRLYAAVRDNEMMEPGDDRTHYIAGSIYGGLMFDFKDEKVTEMFLGAAAE